MSVQTRMKRIATTAEVLDAALDVSDISTNKENVLDEVEYAASSNLSEK